MSLADVLKRIQKRLKVVGLTANAASDQAKKTDAIRNLARAVEAGREGVSTATLLALAPVLKTTAEWLLTGNGQEDTASDEEATIPVWGKAGAGGEIRDFSEDSNPIGAIPYPKQIGSETGAVEISGNSLGPIFDGWYALYDDMRHPPTEDLIGRLCVLRLSDGRVFIKELSKGRGKRFTLTSNFEPPIYDVIVAWAALVKTMVPR